ncbi:MAG: efflux RND transporter periplasmic adaptor subunit [bacterium]
MRRFAPLLTATLLTASGLIGCQSEPPEEPVIRPVRWQQVFATGAERERAFSGTARAGLESRLSFKVGGTVRSLSVNVGDRVTAGTRIAQLDPADYELRLQDARASVTRYEAEQRQASAAYDRIRQLYENKNASRADLDAARAASEAAAAAVTSAEQKLELAQANLDYTRLTAPVDGAISSVPVEVNENVQPGQVIAVLTSGSRAEVTCTIPEMLIGQVRAGDGVSVTFDAAPGRQFAARVTEVGVSAAQGGATFPVTARLEEESDTVLPGMAAEVVFRFGARDGRPRIRVPASAVLEDREGRFAFVVEPAENGLGTVHRREVTVGELASDGLEILSGLTDGDRVVTAGVTKIQDGMTVRLPDASRS